MTITGWLVAPPEPAVLEGRVDTRADGLAEALAEDVTDGLPDGVPEGVAATVGGAVAVVGAGSAVAVLTGAGPADGTDPHPASARPSARPGARPSGTGTIRRGRRGLRARLTASR